VLNHPLCCCQRSSFSSPVCIDPINQISALLLYYHCLFPTRLPTRSNQTLIELQVVFRHCAGTPLADADCCHMCTRTPTLTPTYPFHPTACRLYCAMMPTHPFLMTTAATSAPTHPPTHPYNPTTCRSYFAMVPAHPFPMTTGQTRNGPTAAPATQAA
jgi:hypothetical protein